jgi:hypothetical protein
VIRAGALLLLAGCGASVSTDPFADRVVSSRFGAGATYGHSALPQIVLGPPQGAGANAGSVHVASLGRRGELVLGFDGELFDGPGVDLIVFENPFPGWIETGEVAVSEDGTDWRVFPCAADDVAGGFPGCAGVQPVLSNPENGISPIDPEAAGGDGFDLAVAGLQYAGESGGFDLDAVAGVHVR